MNKVNENVAKNLLKCYNNSMSKMIGKSIKIKYLLSMIVISILITFFGMFKIEAYFQRNVSTNVAFTTKSFTNLTLSFNKAQYSTTEGMILTVSNPNPYNVSYHISLANSNLTYLVDNTTPTQYEVNANSSRVHTILINNPPVGNLSITLNVDFSYSIQISTNIEIVNSATFISGPDFYDLLGGDTGSGGGGVMKYNPSNPYQVINLVNTMDKKIKPIKTSLVELKSDIHSIVRASSLPNDYEEWFTDENIVSTSDSETPIYAWFDYETLYYYSSASILYLNPDSSMMFADLSLEELDISDINTSKVTNMSEMFKNFSVGFSGGGVMKYKYSGRANLIPLNSVLEYDNDRDKFNLNLSNFDTSNVTNMSSMFENSGVGGLNLSSFDTSKVTDMSHMFHNCTSLANLNLSNFNTSKVTNMEYMFYYCDYLTSLNLSSFNTSNVTNMNNMFYGCGSLTTLNLSNFNTSKVTDMSYMFCGCCSLTALNLSNFDTSKVTSMDAMFNGCGNLTTLNLSSFDTSNVMHMSYMFGECASLTALNLSSFNTSKVTDMDAMFHSCSKLISLDISTFDISSVTSAYDMLYDMRSLMTLVTPKVNSNIQITLSSTMRDSSYNLYTKLTPSTPTRTTLTIVQTFITGSDFNVKLKKLSGQSSATYSTQNTTITSIVRVSSLPNGMSINNFTNDNIISINKTINPIYAWYDNGTIYYYSEEETLFLNSYSSYMFYDMEGLTSIDFTNIDSSIVTTMNSMFRYCKSLTSLDLSNFDMSNVTNASSMLSSSSPVTIITPKLIRSGTTIYLSAQMQDNLGNIYTNLTSTTPTQTTLTAMTIFNTGTEVNVKLKKLSGQSDATYSTANTTITSIVRSNTLSITPTSDNIISISNSPIPIYAWYDNGTIYYYSEATILYLNSSSGNMFYSMQGLTSIDFTNVNSSLTTGMADMFYGCSSLTSLNLSNFDTSNVTSMYQMFYGCSSLTSLNLSNFDTSNVTNMSYMFSGCSSLASINLSSFNTSNVTNMSYMFSGCSSLTSINLSSFNTSNVNDMKYMFSGCSSISSLNLSSFDVSLITYPSGMLSNMTSLSTLVTPKVMMTSEYTITLPKIMGDNSDNIYDTLNKNTLTRTTLTPVTVFAQGGIINSKFKKLSGQSDPNTTTENTTITSIVRSSTLAINPTDDNLISYDYSLAPIYAWYSNGTIYYYSATTKIYFDQNSSRMFANMRGLTNVSFTNVSFAYVNDASFMFSNCRSLTSLDLSNSNFKNATKFNSMFEECRNLANLNLSGLNTAKLTNISSMFYYTGYNSGTFSLDVSNWDTSNVTSMTGVFSDAGYNATSFTITGLSSWDTSSVTSMDNMFFDTGRNATTWNIGNLSNWDVSNVKHMSSMFNYAGYNATSFNLNLSNWNTSNVTDMSSMFVSAGRNATTWNIGNLSNWNVSKVTNMTYMFWYAGYSAATWNIGNLSNWNTSNVTSMTEMFSRAGYNATSFSLDLSNWNVSKVTDMASMFEYSGYSATTWNIGNLSNWNTSNVANMAYMFYAAGYNATTWNSIGTLKIYATSMYRMFYQSSKTNGTINIYSNPTNYSDAFYNAATSGPGIVVNYSSTTTNIDNIIATKSTNSNVTKGTQLD